MNLRPIWALQWVPGWPRLQSESLPEKTKAKQNSGEVQSAAPNESEVTEGSHESTGLCPLVTFQQSVAKGWDA